MRPKEESQGLTSDQYKHEIMVSQLERVYGSRELAEQQIRELAEQQIRELYNWRKWWDSQPLRTDSWL